MTRTPAPRRGFSLIEMTVVVAIIGILLTISAGAFVRYFVNARQRATESMMQIVDDQISQRFDSFWRKVNPPIRTRHAVMAGLGVTTSSIPATTEAQAVRLRRAMLLAKLEAMRGDFPQQFADFLPGTSGGLATCTYTATPLADNSAAVPSRTRTAIEQEYRRLTYEKNPSAVPNNAPRGTSGYSQVTQIAPHDHQTESAACLYLILRVGSGDGKSFDLGSIPQSHIRDTDGDGVPEILDAWGTPVRFYRWPTDLMNSLATVSGQLGGNANYQDVDSSGKPRTNNQNTFDPEQLLYTPAWITTSWSRDFEFNGNAATAGMGNFFRVSADPNAQLQNRTTFNLPIYPVIVSAGPDAAALPREDKWQAFGLMWSDDQSSNETPTANITTSWPPVSHWRTRGGMVAQEFSTSYPGAGGHADNIYSRALVAGREAQ